MVTYVEVPEIEFKKIEGKSTGYWAFVVIMAIIAAAGIIAWFDTYLHGHGSTAMNNRVPWGLLISGVAFGIGLSAGALHVFTILADAIQIPQFKPFSRIAPFVATLWIGAALAYITMDIGKVDHMMNVVLHFNPTSIFGWNAFLYSSYIFIALFYLLLKFEKRFLIARVVGIFAFTWAVAVHTGTGQIVGFVFSKGLYHSPMHGVIFVAAAITSGIGGIILMLYLTFRFTNRPLPTDLIRYLAKIMGVGAAVIAYMFICEIFTILYEPGLRENAFFAWFSPFYFLLLWIIMIIIGTIIPIIIIWNPKKEVRNSMNWLCFAGILHVIGVWAERYLVVVPGLQVPEELMGGYEIVRPHYLASVVPYFPSLSEWLMFSGIIAAVLMVYALGIKYFALLPERAEGFE